MHSRLFLRLSLLLCGCALSADAEITFRYRSGAPETPWATMCAGGSLVVSALPAAGQRAVPLAIGAGDYFAQSILGNGQHLAGFAFHGAGANPKPAEYSITLLSYGPSDAIDTRAEFNPATPPQVVLSASFTLGSASLGKLYFEFSGEDRVLLQKGHGYVFLIAPATESLAKFSRLPDGDIYPDGACAKGPVYLNPQAFSSSGQHRDAVFALYTTNP